MKASFLNCLLLLTLLAITAPFILSAPEDGLFTPAELKRNAQRKALGLPPLKPKAARRLVKPVAGKGLNVQKAKGRSPMAPLSMLPRKSSGYIGVYQGSISGPLLGYLHTNKIVPTKSEAMRYRYTDLGLVLQIAVGSSDLHMCVAAGYYGQTLGVGSKNFHLPRNTRLTTSPDDKPVLDSNVASYVETAVFSLDSDTNQIEVNWVNPDGSHPRTYIAYKDERLYYTGDLVAFQEYLHSDVQLVVFKWISRSV